MLLLHDLTVLPLQACMEDLIAHHPPCSVGLNTTLHHTMRYVPVVWVFLRRGLIRLVAKLCGARWTQRLQLSSETLE